MYVRRQSDQNIYPHLRGVFRHCFPIIWGQVAQTGRPQVVRYHGEFYTIAR
jgi:hypothetical protein